VAGAARPLTAKGQLTLQVKGKNISRPVVVDVALPDSIRFETRNDKNKRQCTGIYNPVSRNLGFSCERNSPDKEFEAEFGQAVRMFASYYPPLVIDSLLGTNAEFTGPASGSTESPAALGVRANKESFQFQLGKDFLPDWLGHTGADKVAWRVEFAQYDSSRGMFPRKMVIGSADKTGTADFFFSSVEPLK
jgi:hypothetical protein